MEEESIQVTPSIWKALIIGNAYYNQSKSKKLNHLPHCKADLEKVYEMCKN